MNYTKPVLSVLENFEIKGIAHITGGGLLENIPRILPKNCKVAIFKNSWTPPVIFQLIQQYGNVPEKDMFRTFNMGIGMVLIASQNVKALVMEKLNSQDLNVTEIGEVLKGTKEVSIR
jgi:phosphoribosylformylglycinamidine cyclo-ligase